jgi:methyl-accepting chemotaxis protein/methyl-accepting chemotaxis protein-1 (serine sensor receptor)
LRIAPSADIYGVSIRRFSGLSLAGKLAASFVAILALMTVLSTSSWFATSSLGGMLNTVAVTSSTETELIEAISDGFQEMQDHAKQTQLSHAIGTLEGSAGANQGRCSGCHAIEAAEKDRAQFEATGARIEEKLAALGGMVPDDKSRLALDTIRHNLKDWVAFYREYLKTTGAGQFETAHSIIVDRMLPLRQEIDTAVGQLTSAHRGRLDHSSQEAARTTGRSRWTILSAIGLAALAMVAIVLGLRRTSRSLHGITVELGQRARQMAGMAKEVSEGSQSAAQGAAEQAESLHQVSASAAEINATANRNADRAGASAELSSDFGRSLGEANERLEQLLLAMGEIQSGSEKVASIVRLIDDIAFQTNILALNAAVEAARAGESGLGFAVVAGEVRNLAQRSAKAAKETAVLIEQAIGAATKGKSRLGDVSAAFERLTGGAGRVNALAGEVRSGSLDQARQVKEITGRIEYISGLTDRASAGALEGARSGESLSEEAASLTALVTRLSEVVDGSQVAG